MYQSATEEVHKAQTKPRAVMGPFHHNLLRRKHNTESYLLISHPCMYD